MNLFSFIVVVVTTATLGYIAGMALSVVGTQLLKQVPRLQPWAPTINIALCEVIFLAGWAISGAAPAEFENYFMLGASAAGFSTAGYNVAKTGFGLAVK